MVQSLHFWTAFHFSSTFPVYLKTKKIVSINFECFHSFFSWLKQFFHFSFIKENKFLIFQFFCFTSNRCVWIIMRLCKCKISYKLITSLCMRNICLLFIAHFIQAVGSWFISFFFSSYSFSKNEIFIIQKTK